MKKASLKPIKVPSAKSGDQPATRKMLYLVRDELKSQIQSLDSKIDARFKEQDAKFFGIDARFSSIDARFSSMDAGFANIDAKIEGLTAVVHRSVLLAEEQRADNRIVLEGFQFLMQRMKAVEERAQS